MSVRSNLTLRARLVAGIAFVAIVLIIACVLITISTRSRLVEQVDDRLTSFAPRTSGGEFNPPPGLEELPVGQRPSVPGGGAFNERVSDVYQGFIDSSNELVTVFSPNFADGEYAAPSLDASDLPADLPTIINVSAVDGEITYRVLIQDFGELVSVTGLPINDVEATITRLIWVEVIGSMAILAALAVVGWWVVHLGIRPIKRMTEAATRIAGGDIGERVPESAPGTESGQLAVALNRMLSRIETALAERADSEERLRRFVSDASHELRTPVTSIRGYAELFRVGALSDPAELKDAMRRTEQEAARIGRLVNDMLTLARFDEQRPLARQPVDLGALIRDAANDAGATDRSRTVSVEVAASPSMIIGDEDCLRQVIANLVSNALVHGDGEIHLRVVNAACGVVVEVEDCGDGMPPDVASRVTERFFRADRSRSRDRGGSGLGLAIVDAAVAAHGGGIEIDTTPGHGTIVRLTFPNAIRHGDTDTESHLDEWATLASKPDS